MGNDSEHRSHKIGFKENGYGKPEYTREYLFEARIAVNILVQEYVSLSKKGSGNKNNVIERDMFEVVVSMNGKRMNEVDVVEG